MAAVAPAAADAADTQRGQVAALDAFITRVPAGKQLSDAELSYVVASLQCDWQLGLDLALQLRATAAARFFLRAGANVNAPRAHGLPLLHAAVLADNLEAVRTIIELGADVKLRHNLNTPLEHARFSDSCQVARLLVKHGADPNQPFTGNQTILAQAARWGHVQDCEALVRRVGADVNFALPGGPTPLRAALRARKPQAAKALLALGARIDYGAELRAEHEESRDPRVAMDAELRACATRHDVQLLLACGADVHCVVCMESIAAAAAGAALCCAQVGHPQLCRGCLPGTVAHAHAGVVCERTVENKSGERVTVEQDGAPLHDDAVLMRCALCPEQRGELRVADALAVLRCDAADNAAELAALELEDAVAQSARVRAERGVRDLLDRRTGATRAELQARVVRLAEYVPCPKPGCTREWTGVTDACMKAYCACNTVSFCAFCFEDHNTTDCTGLNPLTRAQSSDRAHFSRDADNNKMSAMQVMKAYHVTRALAAAPPDVAAAVLGDGAVRTALAHIKLTPASSPPPDAGAESAMPWSPLSLDGVGSYVTAAMRAHVANTYAARRAEFSSQHQRILVGAVNDAMTVAKEKEEAAYLTKAAHTVAKLCADGEEQQGLAAAVVNDTSARLQLLSSAYDAAARGVALAEAALTKSALFYQRLHAAKAVRDALRDARDAARIDHISHLEKELQARPAAAAQLASGTRRRAAGGAADSAAETVARRRTRRDGPPT
jgi:hypothetical protein